MKYIVAICANIKDIYLYFNLDYQKAINPYLDL